MGKKGLFLYRKSSRRRWMGLLCIGLGILVIAGVLLVRVQPLIVRLSQNKAESVTLKIINDQVNQLLSEQAITYDRLVDIGYTDRGEIAYVATDIVKLNGLKARISSMIQESFDAYDFGWLSLPIGTIVGGDYFAGRGPSVRFPLELSCSAESTFSNVFDDAGINQTRHQIMLHVTGTTLSIAPWCKTAITVTTDFMIAETVIVGTVPEYYTNVEQSEDLVEDLNNYGFDPS